MRYVTVGLATLGLLLASLIPAFGQDRTLPVAIADLPRDPTPTTLPVAAPQEPEEPDGPPTAHFGWDAMLLFSGNFIGGPSFARPEDVFVDSQNIIRATKTSDRAIEGGFGLHQTYPSGLFDNLNLGPFASIIVGSNNQAISGGAFGIALELLDPVEPSSVGMTIYVGYLVRLSVWKLAEGFYLNRPLPGRYTDAITEQRSEGEFMLAVGASW